MARRMVTPTIREISGVDHPAHLSEGWLLMKDASPATAALLAQAEALATGQTLDTGSTDMPLSKDVLATLPVDVVAHIESLEKAATAAAPASTVAKSADELAADAFEKSLAEVSEPVREVMRKQQRETADARAMAKALFDEREDAKYVTFAKSLAHVPGVTDASATDFRQLAETNPAAWQTMSKTLQAAEAALSAGNVFKELGSGSTGTPGSATEEIEVIAKELQDADTALSFPEAMAKAADQAGRENPALIQRLRSEQLRANSGAQE